MSPGNDEVLVYFACDNKDPQGSFRSFRRPVDPASTLEDRLDAAASAYFAGPLQEEGSHYWAFAGPNALNDTQVHGTRAIIDLDLDGVPATTAAQSGAIWNALRLLAFQFPSITEIEPRHNGSCEAFGNQLQAGECLLALRNGESVSGP